MPKKKAKAPKKQLSTRSGNGDALLGLGKESELASALRDLATTKAMSVIAQHGSREDQEKVVEYLKHLHSKQLK